MDFNQLQTLWDSQNNQTLYAVNETAMYNTIMLKQKQARHITHVSELLIMLTNAATATFIGISNMNLARPSMALYALCAWMLACAVFIFTGRIRRIRGNRRYDRSLHGELGYALSVATYQVQFSRLMRWNTLPIGILLALGLWETGKPLWIALATMVMLLLAYYASGWEHGIYERRKRSLQSLQTSLTREPKSL